MKSRIAIWIISILCLYSAVACADEVILKPQWDVPEYVEWLLMTAQNEIGYREQEHGWTKYGEWAGDGYAQWCAEFLCWCVDQVDQEHNTALLKNIYPLYSGSNSGRRWFIQHGRYVARNGHIENVGYQWLHGAESYVQAGAYIPQPGDWVFLTWTSDTNTDHVAMVEYCTQAEDGSISVHVIEGNNPNAVQRNAYPLLYNRILGYGTVHDVSDWTLKPGQSGEKVRQLQEKLCFLGFLQEQDVDGRYGTKTADAVRLVQKNNHLSETGIANIRTQLALDQNVSEKRKHSPAVWQVTEDTQLDADLSDLLPAFP